MKEKIRVITGSIALTGGAYVSAVAMFLISVLFARYLEKDTFGLYLYVISLAAMIYLFTDFGLDSLSYYFIARNKDKRMDITKSVVFLSVKIKLISSLLVFVILVAIGFMDYRYWYVGLFFIVFVPNYYMYVFIESLQSFRLAGQLQIFESISKLVLIYIVLNYITTTRLSIILIAIMLPMSVSTYLAARDILNKLPSTHTNVNLRELKEEAYHYGKWFTLSSILNPVISNVMQVVLGLMNEFTALAFFGVGKTLSNMILILSSSFKSAFFPSFLKKIDTQSISFALTDSIRFTLIISVFMAFLIHFISVPLITLFYTKEYAESSVIFETLSYGILFSVVFIGLTPAATSAGRPDLRVKIDAINIVVLVTLAIILIPRYSALGATIALTIGVVIGTLIFALTMFRFLKYSFPWKTLIRCIIGSSLAVVPLQFIELGPIYRILLDVCVGTVAYVFILYAIREIQKGDTELVQESIKEIIKYIKKYGK